MSRKFVNKSYGLVELFNQLTTNYVTENNNSNEIETSSFDSIKQNLIQPLHSSPKCESQTVEIFDKQFNTTYKVHDLKSHEFPVIGTYVDKRIEPGFTYRVRNLKTGQYLFNGKALKLNRIGIGYSKRLTFESPKLNDDINHFWSDSNRSYGYALSLVIFKAGEKFRMYNKSDKEIGEVCLTMINDEIPIKLDGREKEINIDSMASVYWMTEKYCDRLADERLNLQFKVVVTKKRDGCKIIRITNAVLKWPNCTKAVNLVPF